MQKTHPDWIFGLTCILLAAMLSAAILFALCAAMP